MALKAATAPVADPDETPEVPADIPRHGNPNDGRPKVRLPEDPTKMRFYRRASKYGKPIEDHFLIHRNERRLIAYGMSRRESLVMEAQAVPVPRDDEDKARDRECKNELERIAEDAIVAAGGREQAAKGSAFHKLSERLDRGEDLAFVGPKTWEALQEWRNLMSFFKIHGTEQFVVWDRYEVAGSYDRLVSPLGIMHAPDGTVIGPQDVLIVDLKSGRWGIEWFGPVYQCQLTIYPSGVPYVHVSDEAAAAGDSGRREWPGGIAPRADWALIPHVPVDSPEDAGLVWVNLREGAELVDLAARNYAARRGSQGFIPAELPVLDEAEMARAGLLEMLAGAASRAELDQLYDDHERLWTDAHTRAAKSRLAELAAVAA